MCSTIFWILIQLILTDQTEHYSPFLFIIHQLLTANLDIKEQKPATNKTKCHQKK